MESTNNTTAEYNTNDLACPLCEHPLSDAIETYLIDPVTRGEIKSSKKKVVCEKCGFKGYRWV